MENWRLKPLLKLSNNTQDYWTVDDAMKGTSILGGTGSGKTTGSGRVIAKQFLKQGWGGLVLCAKTDEAELWETYCKETGRQNDMIIFGKDSIHNEGTYKGDTIVFNPLHYETNRKGEGAGEVFNITNIFMNLYKMGNRVSNEDSSNKDERFWDTALKRILNKTIALIMLAGEELTYKNMIDIIYASPSEKSQYNNNEMKEAIQAIRIEDYDNEILTKNFFLKCLAQAYLKTEDEDTTSPLFLTFDSIFKYFTQSLPSISGLTHTTIIESFMGIAEPFLSGLLQKHFTGETNIYPELAYTENKIIILDFPVKEYLEAGIMAQSIFKLIFQQAIERRNTEEYPTPVFLWADEAQYFINPYDQIFLTTARGSRAATVYLSQNISNYYSAMGSRLDSKAKVNSLMGNLSTKIFHANSDADTNEYASRLIGNNIGKLGSESNTENFLSLKFSTTKGNAERILPQIMPMQFTTLKSGGEQNGKVIESYIFVTGKKWSNNKNYIYAPFKQDI